MQLMIDTAADPTDLLRRAAKFLIVEADVRDADDIEGPALTPPIKPLAFLVDAAPNIDTAAIFGKKPAGLDGHGDDRAPAPPAPVLPAALIAPLPPVILPPPAPTQPAASAGIPQPSAGPVERDSSGLPYDARIHQTARGKKRDGAWKNQKGIDPALVAAVTAELRNAGPETRSPANNVTPAAVAPLPPLQVAPPPPASAPVVAQPGPVASESAPLAPSNTGVTPFRVLMQTITANTNTGKLTNDEVDAALKSVDLPPRQLISLVQNPGKVPGVAAYIEAVLAAKG